MASIIDVRRPPMTQLENGHRFGSFPAHCSPRSCHPSLLRMAGTCWLTAMSQDVLRRTVGSTHHLNMGMMFADQWGKAPCFSPDIRHYVDPNKPTIWYDIYQPCYVGMTGSQVPHIPCSSAALVKSAAFGTSKGQLVPKKRSSLEKHIHIIHFIHMYPDLFMFIRESLVPALVFGFKFGHQFQLLRYSMPSSISSSASRKNWADEHQMLSLRASRVDVCIYIYIIRTIYTYIYNITHTGIWSHKPTKENYNHCTAILHWPL